MNSVTQSNLDGDSLGHLKLLHSIILPSLCGLKYLGLKFNAQNVCLSLNARYIIRSDIDRFMEDGNRIKVCNCLQRGPKISFVALRVSRCNRYIDVQSRISCRSQCFQTRHWSRSARFVDSEKIFVERG